MVLRTGVFKQSFSNVMSRLLCANGKLAKAIENIEYLNLELVDFKNLGQYLSETIKETSVKRENTSRHFVHDVTELSPSDIGYIYDELCPQDLILFEGLGAYMRLPKNPQCIA